MVQPEIKPRVYSVGAQDWQRKIFDELIPLPEGTSYNAYIVRGSEKTALIDTVDPTMTKELMHNLEEIKVQRIDYIICQHAEQDHSGSIPAVLTKHQEAVVVCNEKCKGMLIDLMHIPQDRFKVIQDREELSLGDKTLQFIFTPWVHWPETIVTYLKEDTLLFTCDFFGSHEASYNIFVTEKEKTRRAAKRYYAEIMMPFRISIRKHLELLTQYTISMIAPSHGPVYKEPLTILRAYDEWTGDSVKKQVLIAYVSMHGSTRAMAEFLSDALKRRQVETLLFDIAKTDIGELAMAMVDASTIVLGSPTFLVGPHPVAAYAATLLNTLRPKTKYFAIIGSYGWGTTMADYLTAFTSNIKAEILPPVLVKGLPRMEDLEKLDELAENIASKLLQG